MGGLRLQPEQTAKLVGARKRLQARLAVLRQARERALLAFSMALVQQRQQQQVGLRGAGVRGMGFPNLNPKPK